MSNPNPSQSKFRLLIKAENPAQAIAFAKARGVLLEDPVQTNPREVSGRARALHALDIQRWYDEPGAALPCYGFPLGTLLFFSQPAPAREAGISATGTKLP